MMDFIERLRARHEHVRRRVAVAAGGAAGGIALVGWLTIVATYGLLPESASYASDDLSNIRSALENAGENAPNLAGVAGAVSAGTADGLTVIETKTSSTLSGEGTDERTVIPF